MYGLTFLLKNLTIEFSLEIIGCILLSLIVISVNFFVIVIITIIVITINMYVNVNVITIVIKLKVYDAIHSDIRTTVLRKQVALLSKELHTKRIILQSKKKKFQQTLSCLEYYSLISKVNAYVVKASQTTNKHHQIKLMTLWKSQRRSTPNCLINISHRILTIKEEEALRYGLKHHILPRSVNDISVKTAIEKQIYYLKKDITLLPNSLIEAIKHST